MNNVGMTGALVLIGAGLLANAFMGNTQTAQAVPAPAVSERDERAYRRTNRKKGK